MRNLLALGLLLQWSPLLLNALPTPDYTVTVLEALGFNEYSNVDSTVSVVPIGTAADGAVTTYELSVPGAEDIATLIEGSAGYTLTFVNGHGGPFTANDECVFSVGVANCHRNNGLFEGPATTSAGTGVLQPLATLTVSGSPPGLSSSAAGSSASATHPASTTSAPPSSSPAKPSPSTGKGLGRYSTDRWTGAAVLALLLTAMDNDEVDMTDWGLRTATIGDKDNGKEDFNQEHRLKSNQVFLQIRWIDAMNHLGRNPAKLVRFQYVRTTHRSQTLDPVTGGVELGSIEWCPRPSGEKSTSVVAVLQYTSYTLVGYGRKRNEKLITDGETRVKRMDQAGIVGDSTESASLGDEVDGRFQEFRMVQKRSNIHRAQEACTASQAGVGERRQRKRCALRVEKSVRSWQRMEMLNHHHLSFFALTGSYPSLHARSRVSARRAAYLQGILVSLTFNPGQPDNYLESLREAPHLGVLLMLQDLAGEAGIPRLQAAPHLLTSLSFNRIAKRPGARAKKLRWYARSPQAATSTVSRRRTKTCLFLGRLSSSRVLRITDTS
ncbi:hypothetical protein DFH06DRAFT_1410247 [Mycena polygramma]|nr:hypothetical protein DFH06DRAFT_1410247 [Mycena polygramma]